MNQKIKVVFFDVDGTIYEHKYHDFPASTKQTLKQLKENGYKIVIATGRCRQELNYAPAFFREFDFDAIIYDSGAIITCDHEILEQKLIDHESMQRLKAYCDTHHLDLRYANYDINYFNHPVDPAISDVYFKLYLTVPQIKPYAGEAVSNVLLYADESNIDEIKAMLPECDFTGHEDVYEVTAKNVNKASAIQSIITKWNVAMDEVIAFGDGYNDVEMVKTAGIGVAMGNACDALKEVADYVCEKIGEDGVYHTCIKYGLIEEEK